MVIVKAFAERQQSQQPPISTRFTGTVNCIALLAMFMGLIAYVPVAQETDKDPRKSTDNEVFPAQ